MRSVPNIAKRIPMAADNLWKMRHLCLCDRIPDWCFVCCNFFIEREGGHREQEGKKEKDRAIEENVVEKGRIFEFILGIPGSSSGFCSGFGIS